MDKKRIISICLMVLCLGIFFYSLIKDRGEKRDSKESVKSEYTVGGFHDQGEMWDYLHAHEFVCVSAEDTVCLTVKNYALFMNGEPFSQKLQLSDFQYTGAGLSGFDVKGQEIRIAVMKNDSICTMVDLSPAGKNRVFNAKKEE